MYKYKTIITILLAFMMMNSVFTVNAAEVVRYSSPTAGVTPEIPLNSQGLPALPGEPQVLGTGRAARQAPAMRDTAVQSAAAQNTEDPLTTYNSYESSVEAVGFDFGVEGLMGLIPEEYRARVLYRGKPGTMLELVCFREDGEWIMLRKGIGRTDLAGDIKECDDALVLRDVSVQSLKDFVQNQVGEEAAIPDSSDFPSDILDAAVIRFEQGRLRAVTLYAEQSTSSVIWS